MEERLLRNISIICSLVGLALLFFLSKTIELKPTDISQITYEDIGKNVKVCGEVASKFVSKNNHVFLQVQDKNGIISIVIFNNTAKKLNLNLDSKKVCITGTVDEYKEKLEIIAKDIQVR